MLILLLLFAILLVLWLGQARFTQLAGQLARATLLVLVLVVVFYAIAGYTLGVLPDWPVLCLGLGFAGAIGAAVTFWLATLTKHAK